MELTQVVGPLASAGPLGAIIVYMMWRESKQTEARQAERTAERERLAAERLRRDEIDKDRIATDKALVAALTTLSNKIDGLGK